MTEVEQLNLAAQVLRFKQPIKITFTDTKGIKHDIIQKEPNFQTLIEIMSHPNKEFRKAGIFDFLPDGVNWHQGGEKMREIAEKNNMRPLTVDEAHLYSQKRLSFTHLYSLHRPAANGDFFEVVPHGGRIKLDNYLFTLLDVPIVVIVK